MLAVSFIQLIVISAFAPLTSFMFTSIEVTLDAVLIVRDPFFQMFSGDISLVVFMAAVTGVGCQPIRMTGLAATITISVPDRESMRTIVRRRFPSGCGMARRTIRAELT